MSPAATGDGYYSATDGNHTSTYKSTRPTLRSLPQPPNDTTPPSYRTATSQNFRDHSFDETVKRSYDEPSYSPTASHHSPSNSLTLSRADSMIPQFSRSTKPHMHHVQTNTNTAALSAPDLKTLQNSSTGHLRTLSKFTQNGMSEDFSLASPAPSVIGLHGRRQLKRTDSTRASRGITGRSSGTSSAWAERNWMDKQRQFLQAYEYLCHIGEAKEWIEDIIHKPIPPIVQLEEALRDGVTLAEVVQALSPGRTLRIFRSQKLQFRHSDNIALFFRFLAEVELPELFRFELIDLYEKKNIPKVIYCIHALSWLLYRNGIVDFRIGNLVGQLEFEHHELEEMQKGLDKAGINMPSFSGMGASFGAAPEPDPEPEPEPVESEEDRIARELNENETCVLDLQTQIRGALVRLRLGDKMQGLWESEEMLIELQSRIRGDWTRQIIDYRLLMKRCAVRLQSAARGFIVRAGKRSNEIRWKGEEFNLTTLQSLVRAKMARSSVQFVKSRARNEQSGIRHFQAAVRGALGRRRVDQQYEQTRVAGEGIWSLQSALRGMLLRKNLRAQEVLLNQAQSKFTIIQAIARGMAVRSIKQRMEETLKQNSRFWQALQAAGRGRLLRKELEDLREQLRLHQRTTATVQALIRGNAIREDVNQTRSLLSRACSSITNLQAISRASLQRKQQSADLRALAAQSASISAFQACGRGCLFRRSQRTLHRELLQEAPRITKIQALARAMLLRLDVGDLLARLDEEEEVVEALQAAARGKLVREKFVEKKKFFKANMEKVIKVQSFVRGKLQGEAYKSLTSGKNPPVGTVKGFVHLLNDSDFDFDEEIEFERLRKTVVQHVRQNEMADQYITQLDIKIALLVKNKITLDEVVKHQKHFGGQAGSLLSNSEISSKDPFDLKALNKNSRRKLEHYQELFFLLQTQPQYLARFFKRIREQATAEKECERIKHLTMGLFGYAQKRREEYYLLKVIIRSIREEVDNCNSIQDYLRGNCFWGKLFNAYAKSPRDRKYMRDVLGPIVKENIIDNPELDLESDPMQIYLSLIENEQLRTGQRSQRRLDVPREEAIRDPETKRTFIAHLQDLRDIADQFFAAFEDLLHKMPYGVRYIAQQMFHCLTSRFQHDEQGYLLQIVGQWVWRSYLQPALLEPEKSGVVDRGLSQEQKRNLGVVAKVLGQVAAGRLFGAENVFLQPLNSYVGESIERLGEIWNNCE